MPPFALMIALILAAFTPSETARDRVGIPSRLRDYQTWQTASSEPILVPYELWIQCSRPTRDQEKEAKRRHGPHNRLQIRVFANKPARPSFFSSPMTPFPEGSILVKEKSVGGGSSPVAVAAMIKGKAGSNPSSGDWEFVFRSAEEPAFSTVTAACQDCHRAAPGDFVFGTYSRVKK